MILRHTLSGCITLPDQDSGNAVAILVFVLTVTLVASVAGRFTGAEVAAILVATSGIIRSLGIRNRRRRNRPSTT